MTEPPTPEGNVPAGNILIRPCKGFEEFSACVRLQMEVWGYEPSDVIPRREFVVIDRIGGQVIGAFDLAKSRDSDGEADSMIGFAMSMPGLRDSRSYLHSHMLAVSPAYRNGGIGRKLKLAQRDDALARGIKKMEWTFDPLEIKNAHLNLTRLGAVVHRYTANLYGVSSSRLQAGLPTDRLHAEWWMDSPRVHATLHGGPLLLPEIQETIIVPGPTREWKESAAELARAASVQAEIRSRFVDAFERGLAVVGFSKQSSAENMSRPITGGDSTGGVYQLAEWHEP